MTRSKKGPPVSTNNQSQLLLYQTEDGNTKIEVRLIEETVWLTQLGLAELFQTTKQNISLHIKNIFEDNELVEDRVVKEYLTTAADGKNYSTKFYNLETIIAVGYRVKSRGGTQFRRWATERLNEYLVKGFTMDDDRLKQVNNISSDYFDEMLERIRDIRSSEKRFYQKIRDIYKLAVDYDPKAEDTMQFFQIVQNKLHFAISGKTAAELISERANAKKLNMGLTSWHGFKIRKSDVTVAKNYLNENELTQLNRIVTMYLDYAEDQAKRHKQIFMRDWRVKLDAFLKFNERDVLENAGKVSKIVADQLAIDQYELFNKNQLIVEAKLASLEDEATLKSIETKISKMKKHKKLKLP